ncbi:sigma-54-dependent transcriptional regulator [Acidithiobacillus sulfuriphilus]|uniref:Sigma-54-dependent Fis family transcriptional regulator n=2 Tax=Acidithiobacillus sulfuriphilus TaxID=1867749 RepID=A0A3M8QPB5_9PROT|nr:sigma-54 dependent transcriptional regulator [Acidithiobacillus sulfuriphilus]RNF58123.1 sigma-54-dependent Fis family transcriptional regulator [Acidithiobacillus sulfuriphilus]
MTVLRRSILILDDDPDFLRLLGLWLESEGHDVFASSDPVTGVARLRSRIPDLIISDLRMPVIDGMGILEEAQRLDPDLPVILLTAHGSIPNAVEAMRGNAFGYLSKPFSSEELQDLVKAALSQRQASQETRTLRATLRAQAGQLVLHRSPAMAALVDELARIAGSSASVFLSGESGAGKERIARAIHAASPRAERPFVAVNCGAIPAELAESELFGHVKGSFTGAAHDAPGLVRSADGGTLFLDEIADLPLALQVKLLRVLQEGTLRPVGASREISVDVRVISATHQDIHNLTASGEFREDLYYRLHVIPLRVPSLCERPEDIPLLAQHFLDRESGRLGRGIQGFSPEALDKLVQRPWPGNVRELENAITYAAAVTEKGWVAADAIPDAGRQGGQSALPPLQDAKTAFERAYLENLLRATGGNISRAARIAGRHRTDLYKLMRKHGLAPQLFKGNDDSESD